MRSLWVQVWQKIFTFDFSVERLESTPTQHLLSSFRHTCSPGLMTRQLRRPQQVITVEVQALPSDSCVDVWEPKHFSWLPHSTHWVLEDLVPFQTQQAPWTHSESTFLAQSGVPTCAGMRGRKSQRAACPSLWGTPGRWLPLRNQARGKHRLPKIWSWKNS